MISMMKIGLVRHFKVNHPLPEKKLLSKQQVIDWFAGYDRTEDLGYKAVDLGDHQWKRCYSSTMTRAIHTAGHIYQGKITQIPELCELDILHRLSGRFRLPLLVWAVIVRIKSFSKNSDTDSFNAGITKFLDGLVTSGQTDTLIVSHWFVMRVLRKELLRRGFSGKRFKSGEYGTLYVFEKEEG